MRGKEDTMLELNTNELTKPWEPGFYESQWEVNTLSLTNDEKAVLADMQSFLPRHMPVYDWSRPYAEAIILILRRRAASSNKITLLTRLRNSMVRMVRSVFGVPVWTEFHDGTACKQWARLQPDGRMAIRSGRSWEFGNPDGSFGPKSSIAQWTHRASVFSGCEQKEKRSDCLIAGSAH